MGLCVRGDGSGLAYNVVSGGDHSEIPVAFGSLEMSLTAVGLHGWLEAEAGAT